MSTKTGFAPAYSIAATVATNVNGTVMTSSPGPIPGRQQRHVQRARSRVHRRPRARRRSTRRTRARSSRRPARARTARSRGHGSIAASISGFSRRYCACRSTSGIMRATTAFSSTSTRPLLPQSIRASRSGRERHPSSTNISRSMSLFNSVMCEGSTSNCVVKSSRLAGLGMKAGGHVDVLRRQPRHVGDRLPDLQHGQVLEHLTTDHEVVRARRLQRGIADVRRP